MLLEVKLSADPSFTACLWSVIQPRNNNSGCLLCPSVIHSIGYSYRRTHTRTGFLKTEFHSCLLVVLMNVGDKPGCLSVVLLPADENSGSSLVFLAHVDETQAACRPFVCIIDGSKLLIRRFIA